MKNIFIILFVVLFLFINLNSLHAQWIQTNTGLTNSYVKALAVRGAYIFAGTYNGVFLSTDDGTSWTATAVIPGLVSPIIRALAVSGTNIFAGGVGGVFLSTNNGTTWSAVNNGLTNTNVNALAVSGTNLLAGNNYGGVFLSTNNGASWTDVSPSGNNVQIIYALAVSGTNYFAGTKGGVYVSTDNGKSWTENGVSNSSVPNAVFAVAVSGTNVFAGTGAGVYLSTNDGKSWTSANYSLTDISINAFVISGKNIFAGTYNSGVLISIDNFAGFYDNNYGLPMGLNGVSISISVLSASSTYIFAGTDSGFWRRPLSELVTSAEKLSTELPLYFSLGQNYPNPFNPSTTISFSLPSNSSVSLKVFDALGREVSTILNEELSAGTYSKQWNGARLPSGIYFYRLQAGSFLETKKLVLLR